VSPDRGGPGNERRHGASEVKNSACSVSPPPFGGIFAAMPRFRSLVLLALVPVALVLLGGPLAAAADESGKPPAEILADMQRDLAKVGSYHFSGFEIDGGKTSHLSGDVSSGGRADVLLRQGKTTARIIVLPHATYVKANAAFWRAQAPGLPAKLLRRLADRWFRSADPGLRALAAALLPKRVAACSGVGTGTLSSGGESTLAGKPVAIVVAAGDQPGTTPGRLYVTTTPPILPLRAVQSGPRQPGGQLDPACQDADDTSTASDLRFSRFDEPTHIRAPHGAVKVPSGA
jgi:hypothetical protein